ncbi:His/Gly/Thr/Pro-type tRNA ligase C-terminal domain-containing protein [Oscillatoria sp. FACHB-1407]|uniref:His/Gly/Thr/Pro-type tRNA ligase C-terminal domain-containing protein n=1 Tax=Oscillatoria sp. FACHB-1407 TaxID=2692847 RepID=UPI0018F0593E|nr:His/Gly/Thr/Pro-type tRNA ligase C-terminal domain-containing protein [Oscillatoria sp. FACHB-1407]
MARLKQLGIRVELHNPDQRISKIIRELARRRVPLVAIVGEQEAIHQTLNLRRLGGGEQQEINLAQLEQLAQVMPKAL